jgi:integrase
MKPYRKAAGLNPDGSKRLSPYWWIAFQDASGKRVEESTKTASLTEAKRKLADRLAAVLAQGWVFDNCKKVFLFQELADDYFAWHRGHFSSSEQQAKPRVNHLVTFLGKLDINKIRSEDLTGYRTWRAKQKVGGEASVKTISHSTINREMDLFNAMFNWAKGEDKYTKVLKQNPFVRRKHRTKEPVSPMGWFEPESKRRFLEACDQLPATAKHFPPQLLKSLVHALWGTGLRIDECLSLRKWQVKLDYRMVQLEGWQTKNKQAGEVDLRTDEAFHVFRLACQGKEDKELVFQWPAGDALRQPGRCKVQREPGQIPYSAVASAFKAAVAKAGLVKLTLHSCRKTAATQMAIDGCSVLEIKDALHHKDITTTLKYINQTAVNQVRRNQRNGLKMAGVIGDNSGPFGANNDFVDSATQVRHKV